MRLLTTFATLTLVAAPLAAQTPSKAPRANPPQGTGGPSLPAGWTARTDDKGQENKLKVVTADIGYHVSAGPATIFYRASQAVQGPFRVTATMTQTAAPAHPEGYGIFIGGQGLTGDGQKYTYFLIRGDGTYLIKRRDGGATQNLVSSWSAHPGIVKADREGKATNQLEVVVTPTKIGFLVNGKEVYSADPRLIDASGIVGLRVNHNLDLHVDSFALSAQK
jgi:hypothetical protein